LIATTGDLKLAKILFAGMDFVYGKKRTLSKFKVLEVIARVPYLLCEHVAYIAMTHTYAKPGFARRIFEFVAVSRRQQDNEQWHLLILEELVQKKKLAEGVVLHRVLSQIVAFVYYHISWFLYVIQPRLSYELNADFEDHSQHEYMKYVRENPELERQSIESEFAGDYGRFENEADLFRQIALDERHHKEESLERALKPRFE
jgi:hypothetical protein